jgi:hypothetical protein
MCSLDFPFLFHNHADIWVPCKADQWWQPWTQLVQAEWVAVQLAVSTNFLILHGSEDRTTFKFFLLNLADFAPAYMYIIISVCLLLPTHLFLLLWNSVFFLGLYGEVNDLFWVQSVHLVINFCSSSSWACNSRKRDYAPEQLMIVSTSPIWHSVRRAIILWHLQVSHSGIWIKTLLRKHLKFSFQNSN